MSNKIKILVVDDEAVMRDTMSDWLGGKGYNVVTVSSGMEAIEKVKIGSFNVAFVDAEDWLGTSGDPDQWRTYLRSCIFFPVKVTNSYFS